MIRFGIANVILALLILLTFRFVPSLELYFKFVAGLVVILLNVFLLGRFLLHRAKRQKDLQPFFIAFGISALSQFLFPLGYVTVYHFLVQTLTQYHGLVFIGVYLCFLSIFIYDIARAQH